MILVNKLRRLGALFLSLFFSGAAPAEQVETAEALEQAKSTLTPLQFKVTQEEGTERAFNKCLLG